MATVISHVRNEEWLLPFWLAHHVPMFEHGIIIDYASTDRSVAVVKEMAPHWEVRPSRNKIFNSKACDAEVETIEHTVSGWKDMSQCHGVPVLRGLGRAHP